MTESEWLTEQGHPQGMVCCLGDLRLPRAKAGRRKLRLFACACCRVMWDLFPEDGLRDAVELAEQASDGLKSKVELEATKAALEPLRASTGPYQRVSVGVQVAVCLAVATVEPQAYSAAFCMTAFQPALGGKIKGMKAHEYQCNLLRDIFGNPFQPVKFPKKWRTEHTTGLARKMYDDREFAAMPILADALEEAGCDNTDILTHCREPGVHARGCWVVDLVLGKA